ncbi:hypothetical protein Hanom_Chr09g00759851 [Helianthus anomalus]
MSFVLNKSTQYVRPKKHKVEFMSGNQVAFRLNSIGSHQNSYHTTMVLQSLILFKQHNKHMSYLPLLLLKPIKVRRLGPTFLVRFVPPNKVVVTLNVACILFFISLFFEFEIICCL